MINFELRRQIKRLEEAARGFAAMQDTAREMAKAIPRVQEAFAGLAESFGIAPVVDEPKPEPPPRRRFIER